MLVPGRGFCCARSVCSVGQLVGQPFFIATVMEMQMSVSHADLSHVVAALLPMFELARAEFVIVHSAVIKERSLLCGVAQQQMPLQWSIMRKNNEYFLQSILIQTFLFPKAGSSLCLNFLITFDLFDLFIFFLERIVEDCMKGGWLH